MQKLRASFGKLAPLQSIFCLSCAGILRIEGQMRQVKNSSLLSAGQLEVPCQMKRAQHKNPVPVHVKFIPNQAVTGRLRMRMMIVMPAFPPTQDGDPEAVSGSIVSAKSPRSPHVRG